MAEAGGNVNETFKLFATKGGGAECTSKDVTRWCTDAGVLTKKACSSNNLDIAFSKVKPKGKSTITVKELGPLIDEIAKAYKDDKKITLDEAKADLNKKLAATTPKAHGATKTSKTGNVSGMTDTSKYTGSHKERFDASGKGKGKEGREDMVENTGYVGEYKGEGTYDKSSKK